MMAGEWIKVRTNLWDDPRVSQLCDITGVQEATIIGGLYWVWAMADEHTEDGLCNGLSVTAIDRKTGISVFGAALVSIGWLEDTPEGVVLVRFNEHNGASAKSRAVVAKRVAKHRSHSADDDHVTGDTLQGNDGSVTGPLAREDKNKRRTKKDTTSDSKDRGARGTRLPTDWKPSTEDVAYCKTERPDLLPSKVAQNFFDYWTAKSGKDATKVDWSATWRSWVRKERTENAPRPPAAGAAPPGQTSLDATRQANTAAAERLLFGANDEEGRTIDAA